VIAKSWKWITVAAKHKTITIVKILVKKAGIEHHQ